MGVRDIRHGVVGLFKVPSDKAILEGNKNTLASYRWADTLYYNNFTTWEDISKALYNGGNYTGNDHVGSPFLFTNGAYIYSGLPAADYTLYITGSKSQTDVVPSPSNYVRDVVRDTSNRGKPSVESGGSWNGSESQTYITRISTPGSTGIAKCDVYGPNGVVMSQNNVINNGSPITLSGNMNITFNSDGPYYLNDSWAVKGVVGGITQFVVDVQWEGQGYVNEAVLLFKGTGDQSSNLDAETNAIVVNSGLFGQPFKYGVDYTDTEIGSNLHILLRCKKDNDADYLRVWQVNVLIGDDDGAEAWQ